MAKYLQNCFLLLLPVLLWNILLYKKLPAEYQSDLFWTDIPVYISWPENIFRYLIFIIPAFMILEMKTKAQKGALQMFIYGFGIYCMSWIMQIKFSESSFSSSLVGFTAPAYTSIFFILPISIIGRRNFLNLNSLNLIYISFGIVFVIFHTWHSAFVFQRFH